jgi:altronate dehydratase large subunit
MTNWTTSSWQGYLRHDGRNGVRNISLVIYTVECAKHIAHKIAEQEPGVDAHVIGFPGCYDNEYAIRLMLALCRHPNVGAVLCVGLGCEYTQPSKISEIVAHSGRPTSWFYIQESGGSLASIEKGRAVLRELHTRSQVEVKRVRMTPTDLVLGCECGGSDATSGLVGNPVVGALYDKLIDIGATTVFEEIVEMVGLREILLERAVDDTARQQIAETYDKAIAHCKQVRQYSVSPGNFAGGLSTIEEKSMGALAKSGTRQIQGVIKVAQTPSSPGLWLLDSVPDKHFMQFGYTNPNDTEGIMDLISSGAQIVLFTTGRGSVIGSPIAPLIKLTGNRQTFKTMPDDMDFDASRVLDGRMTMNQCVDDLGHLVVDVASGKQTKPEALGHREYFIMYKHQDAPPIQVGCRL